MGGLALRPQSSGGWTPSARCRERGPECGQGWGRSVESASPSLLLPPHNRSSRWVRGCVECTPLLPLPSPEGQAWPLEEALRGPSPQALAVLPVKSCPFLGIRACSFHGDRWPTRGCGGEPPHWVIGGGRLSVLCFASPPLPPAWTPTTRVAVCELGGSVQPEERTRLPPATPGPRGPEGRRL